MYIYIYMHFLDIYIYISLCVSICGECVVFFWGGHPYFWLDLLFLGIVGNPAQSVDQLEMRSLVLHGDATHLLPCKIP